MPDRWGHRAPATQFGDHLISNPGDRLLGPRGQGIKPAVRQHVPHGARTAQAPGRLDQPDPCASPGGADRRAHAGRATAHNEHVVLLRFHPFTPSSHDELLGARSCATPRRAPSSLRPALAFPSFAPLLPPSPLTPPYPPP